MIRTRPTGSIRREGEEEEEEEEEEEQLCTNLQSASFSTSVSFSDMSSAAKQPCEDQFLCSICLDVFTAPVSTPCGHNFCKQCITEHWDINVRCKCPLCNEVFQNKPRLQVNTFISELVEQFKHEAQQKASSSSKLQVAQPGEVACDVCTGAKLKAVKSCLVCLVSYCDSHLESHLNVSGLRRHQLIQPVDDLQDRMCRKHDKLLELFCRTEQTCVCMLCSVTEHRTHEVVPLKEEYEGKKAELEKTEAEIQQMIKERRWKIQEIQEAVMMSEDAADREKAEGVQVFSALMASVERGLNQLIDRIEERQRTVAQHAEDIIEELEQEVCELMKRRSEVEQLWESEDQLHLIQSVSSLEAAPPTKDWTEVGVRPPSYEGMVVGAVAELEEALSKDMKEVFEAELRRLRCYAADVTLDPETANPALLLSDDGKTVSHCETQNLPENPERFSYYAYVLGKQSFSLGRFYFEVQVKGKTRWSLGVASESINRKGLITLRPQNGCWIMSLKNENEYKALARRVVCLSLRSRPEKVGVFVDYEEGLVSFYHVDAAALIYSFTDCKFTGRLHPFFCPGMKDGGKNMDPLIICRVTQTQ